jgi:hypothetical protein
MGTYKPELKAECIRLRLEETKSFLDIIAITGVSKGSLSVWLKPYPLPDFIVKERQKAIVRYCTPKKNRGEESAVHQMTKTRNLDANQKSKVSELAVALRMAAMGFEVFGAVSDGTKADWVVLIPSTNKVWKIQVKLTRKGPHGLPYTPLRCSQSSKKYAKGEFDFIVGYDLFTDTAYVWSWDEIGHLTTTITVCPDAMERWDKLEVL